VGWIVIGGSAVHESQIWEQGFNLVSDEASIPGYQRLTAAVHDHGTKISTQIDVYGIGVPPDRPHPWPVYAPSMLPTSGGEMTKQVDEDDMRMFIDATVKGVEVALAGGFDGVELVATFDTSLIQNFLSPRYNHRTDEYGGSLENRMRYPTRVLEAVRNAMDGCGCVGLKIVGDEMVDGGLTQDDVKEICARIDGLGLVDYIHVSIGTITNYHLDIPEMSYPPGFVTYLAAGVREQVRVPVVAVARIDDPRLAEKILADGHADAIGMTRPLIADPDLPNKSREGRVDEIRQCTSSNQECSRRAGDVATLPIRCVQNPAVGMERVLGRKTLGRVAQAKSVVVVGGGPAGMRAAKVAAQRGHRVRLYEKGERLGGQVLSILEVPSRSGYESIIRYLIGELDRRGVDVQLGVDATAQMIQSDSPDAVIVATGALGLKTGYSPALQSVARMPGADQDHVLTVFDVFSDPDRLGQTVLLVDDFGQYEGMITAEHLTRLGKRVVHVTRNPYVGVRVDGMSLTDYGIRLAEYDYRSVPQMAVTEIDGKVVRGASQLDGAPWSQEADNVVLLMGKLPNEQLFHQLRAAGGDVRRVGDCLAPRNITDAIFEGNAAGREI
jgi:2,4-dienoyl-CoA reductase-like NADH-dependent reductase (Old Yellow Enzyme family)